MRILNNTSNIFNNTSISECIQNIKFNDKRVYIVCSSSLDKNSNLELLEKYIIELCILAGFHRQNISIVITNSNQRNHEYTMNKPEALNHAIPKIRIAKRMFAVCSCKGGVGKSTIAANLALYYAQHYSYNIGLIDADIYGSSIPIMFNIEDSKMVVEDNQMLPIVKFNIQIASIGFVTQNTPLLWRGPMITKAIKSLFEGVKWDNLDIAIIDLPPGTGDIYLSLLQKYNIDSVILVSTPDILSSTELRKTIQMMIQFNIPIAGIVKNMSDNKNGVLEEVSEEFNIPIILDV